MRPKSYRTTRQSRQWNLLTRAFVWVVLAIFILTSVGVALVMVR